MDILLILVFLLVGIGIGSYTRPSAKWLKITKPLSLIGLFSLIFLLGVKIGSAPQVTQHLRSIGYQGIVLALCTVIGSVIAGYIIIRFLPENFRK